MRLKNLSANHRNRGINIRVTQEEYDLIQAKASLYTEGNMAAWLRYAGIQLIPKTKDIEGMGENNERDSD